MNMSQAMGIVTIGTLLFHVADLAKSNYVKDQELVNTHLNHQQLSSAEIDRSNRELAKDYAFLYNNPSLEEPMYQKLSKTVSKSKH